MSGLELVVGNKNFSSWSLRAWLALKQTGAPFREVRIWLDEDDDRRQRKQYSPTGRVPVLLHGKLTVWDSLAIGEYLAELYPRAGLWPGEPAARACARSLCAEMHSGFQALRERMPMNVRARKEPRDRGVEARRDVERVLSIWTETWRAYGGGGPYLFGERTLADHFYTPVATRLRTYAVPLEGDARVYCETLLDHPDFREWEEAAAAEEHVVEPFASAP